MVPRRRSTRSRHHFSCALSLSPGVMRYDTVYEISMTLIIIVAAGTTLRLTQLPCARDTCIISPTHIRQLLQHILLSTLGNPIASLEGWKRFFFSHQCQLSPTLTTLVLVNITLHVSVCFSQNGQFVVCFPVYYLRSFCELFSLRRVSPCSALRLPAIIGRHCT